MNVIYADELFLENAVIDYILLILTAHLSGITIKKVLAALAAALGGLYGVASALSSGFWGQPVFKIVSGVLMVLIVFGKNKSFFKILVIFFAISATFAGAVMAAITFGDNFGVSLSFGSVTFKILIFSFCFFYGLFSLIFHRGAKHQIAGEITSITIQVGQRKTKIPALIDTGNTLCDPITGKNITVCTLNSVRPLFSQDTLSIIEAYHDPSDAMKRLGGVHNGTAFCLVPFSAVGVKCGMLLAFRPDYMECGGKKQNGLVAITIDGITEGKGYSALTYAV